MGLDDPFIVRYVNYVAGLVKGDMGESYTYKTPVAKEIAMRLPNTFLLAFSGVFLQVVIGIPIGVIAAKRQYGIFDNVSMVVSLFFAAAPVFWMGLLFVLVFSVNLRLLPASGMGKGFLGVLKTLILPSFALGLSSVASTVRITRASMLEVIRQDYIDTARAKGTPELTVTTKHMLKNAMIPVVTAIGLQFGVLLGGSVLTETIFAWPGIGRYVIEAIKCQDIPSVLGCVVSLSIMFTVINLMVDILYAYIDPRIKAQYKSARG
jgi:peptide/nickel transport system permease protein